jgi:antitoxin CptB
MTDLQSSHGRSERDRSEIRQRRLLFRAWHRGTQESDLILGTFAELWVAGFDAAQLDRFESLLDCSDAELFDWIIGGAPPSPEQDHDVLRLLRNFCAKPDGDAQPTEVRT